MWRTLKDQTVTRSLKNGLPAWRSTLSGAKTCEWSAVSVPVWLHVCVSEWLCGCVCVAVWLCLCVCLYIYAFPFLSLSVRGIALEVLGWIRGIAPEVVVWIIDCVLGLRLTSTFLLVRPHPSPRVPVQPSIYIRMRRSCAINKAHVGRVAVRWQQHDHHGIAGWR